MKILKKEDLEDYFESLSKVFNVDLETVKELAETFGEAEYFDGLISALEIYNNVETELSNCVELFETKSELLKIEDLFGEMFLTEASMFEFNLN